MTMLHAAGVARSVCAFFDVATHAVLHARGVYPPTVFDRGNDNNLNFGTSQFDRRSDSGNAFPAAAVPAFAYRCRAPIVCEYVSSSVEPLAKLFLAGAVDRFAVVVLAQMKEESESSASAETASRSTDAPVLNAQKQNFGDKSYADDDACITPVARAGVRNIGVSMSPLTFPVERFVFEFVLHGRCDERIDPVTGLPRRDCEGISHDDLISALSGVLGRIGSCGGAIGTPEIALRRACEAHNEAVRRSLEEDMGATAAGGNAASTSINHSFSQVSQAQSLKVSAENVEHTFMLAAETRPAASAADAAVIADDLKDTNAWMDCSHDDWHQTQLQMRAHIASAPSQRPPTQHVHYRKSPTCDRNEDGDGDGDKDVAMPNAAANKLARESTVSTSNARVNTETAALRPRLATASSGRRVVLTPLRSLDLVCGTLQLYVEHFA